MKRWVVTVRMSSLLLGAFAPIAAPGAPTAPVVSTRETAIIVPVRIPSEPGVVLAGSLHLPARRNAVPVPLVVLIQGHGPNGRNGYSAVIARLTADGIAALEYDKRGIGASTGTYIEDAERLTADAMAAVAAMRQRLDIDGGRIAVLGHSQGGIIAPAVAAADPRIAGVVTLAGSVGDGLPYLRRALQDQMIAAGRPGAAAGAAADAAIAVVRARLDRRDAAGIALLRTQAVARFVAAGFTPAQAEQALAMIDTDEVLRADRLRSATDLRALHMPVLAVFGTKDPLVVATTEAPAARQALAGNPKASVVVLNGLSHWFQEGAVTGQSDEVPLLGGNASSPRMIALVGDWLDRVLAVR